MLSSSIASLQKSTTERSSARLVGQIEHFLKLIFSGFKLVLNIFRRCPKAKAVTFSNDSHLKLPNGIFLGINEITAELTLGCG